MRRPSWFWQFPIATLCCNASARCALLHLAGVVPIAQFTEVNVVLNVRLTVANEMKVLTASCCRREFQRRHQTSAYDESDEEDGPGPGRVQCAQQ